MVVFEGEEGLSYEKKSSFSEALIEKLIPSPGLTWSPEGGGCLKSGKGYVLASGDMVPIDAISAKMMGFDPMSLTFIRLGHEVG